MKPIWMIVCILAILAYLVECFYYQDGDDD
jgi:hypothetical protein